MVAGAKSEFMDQPKFSPRLQRASRDQMRIDERSLEQLLPGDHSARVIWDYVTHLDLSPLLSKIKAVAGQPGQPAIDPHILLSLWLLATIDGVGSARELDRLCREHIAYEWLCGEVTVNYHTLSDFRSENEAFFSRLLTESVASLMHQGLVDLQEVAQDGMRVRASAGAHTFRRKPSLKQCLHVARRQVAALKKQSEDKDDGAVSRRQQSARERGARQRQQRIEAALRERDQLERKRQQMEKDKGTPAQEARASTTDPEARKMKMADGGFRPAYNAELATDTSSGIIVGVDVVNAGSDQGQLRPMVEQIEHRFGRTPDRMLADGDFAKRDDIEHLGRRKIEVYTPIKNATQQTANGLDPYQPKAKDGPAVAAWRRRMGTEDAKETYKRRASTAEWVNARFRNMGLRQFRVRGLIKVRAVTLLFALAHNLMQTRRLNAAAALS